MPTNGKALQTDRQGLQAEGFESGTILRRAEKRIWYRPDGTPVGMLPVDVYHEQKFRAHGWTLTPTPLTGAEKHYADFDKPTRPQDRPTDEPEGAENKEDK